MRQTSYVSIPARTVSSDWLDIKNLNIPQGINPTLQPPQSVGIRAISSLGCPMWMHLHWLQ